MVVKTLPDSRELAFLIRQIDEYIQVMEVLIRKTPALDTGELAWREEKAACRQTGRTWAKERYQRVWLGGAALVSMMESPDLGNFHNAAVRWFLNWS